MLVSSRVYIRSGPSLMRDEVLESHSTETVTYIAWRLLQMLILIN